MASTPDGKTISARNSTTHGVFSQQTVLPHLGEDPTHFDTLLDELTAQYTPRIPLDHHYVEQIARALWRLRRLTRCENELLADPERTDEDRHKQWERILRLDSMLRRQIDKAVKVLSAPAAQNCQNELPSCSPVIGGRGASDSRSVGGGGLPDPPLRGGTCASAQGGGFFGGESPTPFPSIAALRKARQQKMRKRTGNSL